jgi:voltage-gated potassium channel Kch
MSHGLDSSEPAQQGARKAAYPARVRSALRPRWLVIRPAVLLGGALGVAVFGYIGFREQAGATASVSESIYDTAQLFILSASVEAPTPWQLEVARGLATLLVGYAGFALIVALFREQFDSLRIWRFHEHVVVVGLADVGSLLATSLSRSGYLVVAVTEESHKRSDQLGLPAGIPVVAGVPTDPDTLRRANIARASYLIVSGADDARNIETALAGARVHEAGDRPSPLRTLIELADLGMCRVLQGLSRDAELPTRFHFFSTAELEARVLVEQFLPRNRNDLDRIVLIGSGQMAQAFLAHVARRMRGRERGALDVELRGADAREFSARVATEHPYVGESLRLTTHTHPHANEQEAGTAPAELAFVLSHPEAEALKLAYHLAQSAQAPQRTIVAIHGTLAPDQAPSTEAPGAQLIRVNPAPAALTPELLFVGEALAKAIHGQFVQDSVERGMDPMTPELADWSELPPERRAAQRRAGQDLAESIEQIGLVIAPLTLDGSDDDFADLTTRADALAELAHESWVRARAREGWSAGPSRDGTGQAHPAMVPWAELGESERAKDTEITRQYPGIFARAGFQILDPRPFEAPTQQGS